MTSASTSSDLAAAREANPSGGQPVTAQPVVGQQATVTAGRPELEGLPQRPARPGGLNGAAVHLHGREPAPGQVQVTVGQAALRQIEAHGASNLRSEVGGVLLGHASQDNGRIVVEVLAALPVVTDDHGPVHFTFTADAWAQLHQDRTARYPTLQIVGWFHTHPDLGVFYSSDDVVVHSVAFVLPWHVGLVLDPVRNEGSFFGWQPGPAGAPGDTPGDDTPDSDTSGGEPEYELAPLNGYYELLDEQAGSVANWRVVRTTVWRQGAPDGFLASQVYLPSTGWPALPPISPWVGAILGGLSLLISLILLLERLLN
ncbi:MAG: Mov34/MPN/PAD-1 family protein [Chloroflexi bacterium]|nr:Mov34/MPN/PAD-1 family protein [Chloroflexota bacterium]MCI0578115.1 Mov34/MPN/PAD-1 family protein [Chloroflexota bacterium]MCI0644419.1 Mov34/MPN/PAD-1 family protein [Chloroflexota bacterium]MCI0727929.1 Mov34/MPN/PAD-1 family protein [Chloroflexota bacterium]